MDQQQLHTALLAHMYNNKLSGGEVAISADIASRRLSEFLMFGNYDFGLSELVRLSLAIGLAPELKFEKLEEE